MDKPNLSGRDQLFSTRSVTKRAQQEENHLNSRRFKSPFYDGATMYGGSSARISRLPSTHSPYAAAKQSTYLTRIKDSDIKRSESNQPLSNSVKNIFKNMDKINSPVQDAKRMQFVGSSFTSSLFEPSKPFRRQTASQSTTIPTGYASSLMSSISEKPILKWESSSLSNNNTSFKNFNTNMTKDDEATDLDSRAVNSAAGGGKMRLKVCSTRSKVINPEERVEDTIEYPSVPLPIKNMPTFSFVKKDDTSDLATKSSTAVGSEKRSYLEMMSAEHEAEFAFSAPKMIKYALMKMKTSKNSNEETGNKPSTSSVYTSQQQLTAPQSSLNRSQLSADLKNMNPPSAQAVKFADTVPTPNVIKGAAPKLPQSSTGTGGNIPEEKSSLNKPAQKSNSSLFATPPNTWDCDICLTRNNVDKSKCEACECEKAARKPATESYTGYNFGIVNTKRDAPTLLTGEFKQTTDSAKIGEGLFAGIVSKENISANLINSVEKPLSEIMKPNSDPLPKENGQLFGLKVSTALNEITSKPFELKTSSTEIKFESANKTSSEPETKKLMNSWGDRFAKPKDKWSCKECFVLNDNSAQKCISCETPNPNGEKPEPKQSIVNTTFTLGPVSSSSNTSTTGSAQFKLPLSDALPVKKATESDKDTTNVSKPFTFGSSAAASTSSAFAFGNTKTTNPLSSGAFTFGASSNTSSVDKPTSAASSMFGQKSTLTSDSESSGASAPTPGMFGSLPKAASSTLKPIENSFGTQFARPAGSWECSACFVVNKEDLSQCVSCETPRPGKTNGISTASSLTNSTNSTKKDDFSTGAFKFGASTDNSTSGGAQSSLFSLPTSNASTDKVEPFKFPVSAFTTSPASGSMTTTTTTSSVLGSALTSTNSATKTGFNFGSSFSTGASSATPPSTGFSFNIPSTASSQSSAPAATGGFNFGSSLAAAPAVTSSNASGSGANASSPFIFGQSNSGSVPAAPTFSFSNNASTASNANTAPPPFGSTSSVPTSAATVATNGGFNFGVPSAPTANGGPALFGSSAPTAPGPSNQFNPGQPPSFNFANVPANNFFQFAARPDASANPVQRNIKKAKRRLGPTS